MARWRDWLRCIGQAVVAKGLRALLEQVPFGALVFDVASDALARINREQPAEQERRASLQALVQAPAQDIQQEALAVARQAAPEQPPEVQQRLAGYLMQVPGVVRISLRRRDDPTGTTVPAQRSLSRPEDLLPLLPTRVPRFKAGDRPPGIGDWELVQLLGVGGFGEVWKARNPHFDGVPPVALKFCLDPAAQDRLLRHEAAVLNQMMRQGKHAGIVALQHTYLSADPPCLAYEYVAGGDLAGAIQRWHHKPAADLAARVSRTMLALSEIVAFAHRLNPPVVHRDLKPANILLQQKDGGGYFLRLTDFGIGGLAAEQMLRETRSGTTQSPIWVTGLPGSYTPLYASPQQINGEPPDPRDDVHALGVIWLQMLTGDLTRGAVADWRDELAEHRVPEPVMQVLAKCLASRAERRLASAVLLREELSRLTQPAPAVIPPVSTPPPLPRAASSAPPLVKAKTGILALLQARGLPMNAPVKAAWHIGDEMYPLAMNEDHIEVYQRYPTRRYFPAKFDNSRKYLVTFMGQEKSRARFFGVYEAVGAPVPGLDKSVPPAPKDFPYENFHVECRKPGQEGWYYDLKPVPGFADLKGVVIDWGPGPLAWCQWLIEPVRAGVFEQRDKAVIEGLPGP